MSYTIVGLFNDVTDARQAEQQLLNKGFSRDCLKMQGYDEGIFGSDSSSASNQDYDENSEGLMQRIRNMFSDMFDDDDEAGHYSEAVRRGGTVLSVTIDDEDRVDEVSEIMTMAGADDIDNRVSEWRESGYTSFDEQQQPYTADQIAQERRGRVIPVIQEELEVGKRQVDMGKVRVYSHMVETPVSETVNLREQHASINRHAVNREATEGDLQAFRDDSVEIHEMAEKAVVSKNARVVEEVEIDTEESTTSETINDTVRHTEVKIDRQNHKDSYGARH